MDGWVMDEWWMDGWMDFKQKTVAWILQPFIEMNKIIIYTVFDIWPKLSKKTLNLEYKQTGLMTNVPPLTLTPMIGWESTVNPLCFWTVEKNEGKYSPRKLFPLFSRCVDQYRPLVFVYKINKFNFTYPIILGEQFGEFLIPPLRCFFLGDSVDGWCSSSTANTCTEKSETGSGKVEGKVTWTWRQ